MKKDRNSPNTKYQIPNTNSSGQSLVEVMAAVAILALVLTALVLGTTVAVRNAAFSKDQARATKYAQEGMEKVRTYRDQEEWETFKSECRAKLIPLGSTDSAFTRIIKDCDEESAEKLKVTIEVSWQGTSGKIHQSELTSYFTKWQ